MFQRETYPFHKFRIVVFLFFIFFFFIRHHAINLTTQLHILKFILSLFAETSFPLVVREAMNSSWSANQGDSASSSDETSSANGDSLFSMFSGPDLVAAVKQRR